MSVCLPVCVRACVRRELFRRDRLLSGAPRTHVGAPGFETSQKAPSHVLRSALSLEDAHSDPPFAHAAFPHMLTHGRTRASRRHTLCATTSCATTLCATTVTSSLIRVYSSLLRFRPESDEFEQILQPSNRSKADPLWRKSGGRVLAPRLERNFWTHVADQLNASLEAKAPPTHPLFPICRTPFPPYVRN